MCDRYAAGSIPVLSTNPSPGSGHQFEELARLSKLIFMVREQSQDGSSPFLFSPCNPAFCWRLLPSSASSTRERLVRSLFGLGLSRL
ncbi:MAG: hypothetical protein KME35_18610 [Aphanocapsa sp. GSE-SYN-MK-11-07L]|nr:hypothetical protein [Aphanocapsa sp. GSE-SYN-MK-11-07L]